jgi:tetratricopeptide (TPR) repeat protein
MHDSNKKVAKLSKEYYSEYLNNKGFELAEKGDLKSALNYYLKCEKISLQLGDLTTLGLIYSSIGAVYERQNDKKNALVSYRLALKYNKASNAERNMVATYNNLGACYAKLNEADSSLFCLLEGIKIAEKNKFKNQIITRLLFNVGNDYFKKGDLKLATEYFNILFKSSLHPRFSPSASSRMPYGGQCVITISIPSGILFHSCKRSSAGFSNLRCNPLSTGGVTGEPQIFMPIISTKEFSR